MAASEFGNIPSMLLADTHTLTKKIDSESHPSQSHHINACCKKSRHCYFIKLFQDSLHFLTLTKKLKLSFS